MSGYFGFKNWKEWLEDQVVKAGEEGWKLMMQCPSRRVYLYYLPSANGEFNLTGELRAAHEMPEPEPDQPFRQWELVMPFRPSWTREICCGQVRSVADSLPILTVVSEVGGAGV